MQKLTDQQKKDIEQLKPWAMNDIYRSLDVVKLFKVVDGVNVYMLGLSSWGKGHRVGSPILAIIDNGKPKLLDFNEVLQVIAS